MNDREAATVLGVLTAAWPSTELPAATVKLWLGMLATLDQHDAMSAAHDCVRHEHYFPSIAKFLNQAEAHGHRRRNLEAVRHGLPSGHRPTAPPARLLAASRQLLAELKVKEHDHRGPDPCPVCGGVNPAFGDAPK